MKHIAFILISLFAYKQGFAQSYKLTHFQLTVNSNPQPYDGPTLVVSDTFLTSISDVKTGDSSEVTIVKERILKNKKGRYIKTQFATGANNYYFEPSDIKAEKNAGIYDITLEVAYNNGTRKTLFFKGKILDSDSIKK